MAVFGITSYKTRKYKPLMVPSISLVASLILIVYAFNFFWSRISRIRTQSQQLTRSNSVLSEKVATLQQVSIELEESADIVVGSLPQYNPSVSILRQLSDLEQQLSVDLDNIEFSAGAGQSALKNVSLDFEVVGSYPAVSTFISELSRITPIVKVDEVRVKTSGGNLLKAEISLVGYYSELPTEIPAPGTSIDGFSDSEKATISVIDGFKRLPSTSTQFSNAPRGRENPFSGSFLEN